MYSSTTTNKISLQKTIEQLLCKLLILKIKTLTN